MNFGLIAVALIFLGLALLVASSGQAKADRVRTERRLDSALSKSIDPLLLKEKDPLKKKYVPQWLTDNLISAGMQVNQATGLKIAGVLFLPSLLMALIKGPANGVGTLLVATIAVAVYIYRRQRKRREQMLEQLPAFLDNVVRVGSVGYSITVSFNTAMEQAEEPLAGALSVAVQMQYAGLELDEAMLRLARVYGLTEFKLIASVVSLALSYGGKSDILLSRMAQYLRDRAQYRQEMMAMSSETRTSAFFMTLLTPSMAGVLLMVKPEYMQTMWADELGRTLLFVSAGLQLLGAFLIYRTVRNL